MLVGTALVAKGLDVPQVTLVGVVSADIALNLPDERAAERTYQLLAQAVGRAGRGERPGRALIQTYLPDHPAIAAPCVDGDAEFYDAELESRRVFGSPPFGRADQADRGARGPRRGRGEGDAMAASLRERSRGGRRHGVEVLGPVPAYVARRAGKWRFHVVLRGADPLGRARRRPGRAVVGRRRPREPFVGRGAITSARSRRRYEGSHDERRDTQDQLQGLPLC